MDALNLLTTRRSSKKLTTPAPNAEQLEQMLQAATQVPDHGNMRPYRFTVIQSEAGLQRFRELLSNTVTELNFGHDAMKKPTRRQHGAYDYRRSFTPNRESGKPKPEWEQMLTAAAPLTLYNWLLQPKALTMFGLRACGSTAHYCAKHLSVPTKTKSSA